MTSQSIILNLNKDFAQSEAHSYLQPVSQAFDIGKEAEVSLYGATLQRKPLLVEDKSKTNGTTTLDVEFITLPTVAQQEEANSGTLIDQDKLVKPYNRNQHTAQAIIEQGAYSIEEFSQRLTLEFNANITQQVDGKTFHKDDGTNIAWNGKDVKNQMPYSWTYKNSDDNYYIGFQGTPFRYIDNDTADVYPPQTSGLTLPSQHFTLDNTEGVRDASTDVHFDKDTGNLRGIKAITANTAIGVTDYSRYGRISDSPLFPLFQQNAPAQIEEGYAKNQTYFEWKIDFDNSANNYTYDACVGFTNTYLQSKWAVKDVPDTVTIVPTGAGIISKYPQCILGIRMYEDHQGQLNSSILEVFAPALLSERMDILDDQQTLDRIFAEGLVSLFRADMRNTELEGLTVGVRFIAHKREPNVDFHQHIQDNATLEQGRDLYDRVYSFQVYVDDVDGKHVVYDSAIRDVYMPGNLIDDCIFMNSVGSSRVGIERTNLGLQPYFWANKMGAGDGISFPRGNYLAYFDYSDDYFIVRTPATDYEFKTNSKSLREILGISQNKAKEITLLKGDGNWETSFEVNNQRRFNPNAFPRYPKEAGLTKLYADNTQYNIEVNLPVKAYNTTTSTQNNIGQKRTIVYKTEPLVDGESQGIAQVYVNKNIVPNNLKFLTLNNSEPLNLNNMNVQIRRSHNNELATELEDASVELLVKSK
jgi:hypothetical protein